MNHISRAEFDNLDAENDGKKSQNLLYDSLPDTFDKATLEGKSREFGIKSPARTIVYLWKQKGLVTKVSNTQWGKTK